MKPNDSFYLIEKFVTTRPGEPIRLLPFGPLADNWTGKTAGVSGIRNDAVMGFDLLVTCDASRDIYFQTVASGASTLDVWLQVWGYAI